MVGKTADGKLIKTCELTGREYIDSDVTDREWILIDLDSGKALACAFSPSDAKQKQREYRLKGYRNTSIVPLHDV